MPGKAFLDSNILIYAVGEDDARRAIADALIVQDAVVSAEVLAETASEPVNVPKWLRFLPRPFGERVGVRGCVPGAAAVRRPSPPPSPSGRGSRYEKFTHSQFSFASITSRRRRWSAFWFRSRHALIASP